MTPALGMASAHRASFARRSRPLLRWLLPANLALSGALGSEPHLHLHHQRQPVQPENIGLAEGLPLFFRDHDEPPMPSGGVNLVGKRAELLGPVLRHLGPTSAASATGAQKGQP